MAIQLDKVGPPLTEAEIVRFEAEIGIVLPRDFREFLLKHNGGFPRDACYWFDQYDLQLFEIFRLVDDKLYGLRGRYTEVNDEGGGGLIPLGRDSGDGLIVIDSSDDRVYRICEDPDEDGFGELRPVAESFTAFWDALFEAVDQGDIFTRIAEQGAAEDVQELIEDDWDLTQKSVNGYTLVEEAAKYGNVPVLNACLEYGCAIGESLHCAIRNRAEEAARILVAKGASLDALDRDGQKPEDYIFQSHEMAELIAEFRRAERDPSP